MKLIEVKKWDSVGVMVNLSNVIKCYVLDSGRTDSVSDIEVLMSNLGCTFVLSGDMKCRERWDL